MTNYERSLFSDLLDVNWEISKGDHKPAVKMALINRYSDIVSMLEDSMGKEAWGKFMNDGHKMFAPKGGYGDESPEEVERMYASV